MRVDHVRELVLERGVVEPSSLQRRQAHVCDENVAARDQAFELREARFRRVVNRHGGLVEGGVLKRADKGRPLTLEDLEVVPPHVARGRLDANDLGAVVGEDPAA